jgi:hypothetical protein
MWVDSSGDLDGRMNWRAAKAVAPQHQASL